MEKPSDEHRRALKYVEMIGAMRAGEARIARWGSRWWVAAR